MSDVFRVFVGTMHSQEGDFQSCLKRVQEQEGVTYTHHVISGLREKEAHNALWAAWRKAAPTHDVFVKLDADTVLVSRATLFEVCKLFVNPRVTGAQAPLHDYMTDGLINGLNAFSPRVTFRDTGDELFCDRQVDEGHDVVLRGDSLPPELRPAGLHCHECTDKQAFHYGVHRMLKGQKQTISSVYVAWARDLDRTRMFALLGAQMSSRFATNKRFNYSDVEFEAAFNEAIERYDELSGYVATGELYRVQ